MADEPFEDYLINSEISDTLERISARQIERERRRNAQH